MYAEMRFNCSYADEELGSDFPSREPLGCEPYNIAFTSGQRCGPLVHVIVRAVMHHLEAP
jgi:hypothetical protein